MAEGNPKFAGIDSDQQAKIPAREGGSPLLGDPSSSSVETSRPRRGDPPSPEDEEANGMERSSFSFSPSSASAKKVRRSLAELHGDGKAPSPTVAGVIGKIQLPATGYGMGWDARSSKARLCMGVGSASCCQPGAPGMLGTMVLRVKVARSVRRVWKL